MDIVSSASGLKSIVEVIETIRNSLRSRKKADREFWLNEVLSPIHTEMEKVNQIYIVTFTKSTNIALESRQVVLETVAYLRDVHHTTQLSRDNLMGLINATADLENTPESIEIYIRACRAYFFLPTSTSVATPIRAMLEHLKPFEPLEKLSIEKLERLVRRDWRDLIRSEVAGGFLLARRNVGRGWPEVVTAYHKAKLYLLQP